jgi:hypothetical protein
VPLAWISDKLLDKLCQAFFPPAHLPNPCDIPATLIPHPLTATRKPLTIATNARSRRRRHESVCLKYCATYTYVLLGLIVIRMINGFCGRLRFSLMMMGLWLVDRGRIAAWLHSVPASVRDFSCAHATRDVDIEISSFCRAACLRHRSSYSDDRVDLDLAVQTDPSVSLQDVTILFQAPTVWQGTSICAGPRPQNPSRYLSGEIPACQLREVISLRRFPRTKAETSLARASLSCLIGEA